MPFKKVSAMPALNLDVMENDLKTMPADDLRQTLRTCVHTLIKLGVERDTLFEELQKTGLFLSVLVGRSPDRSVTIAAHEIENLVSQTDDRKNIAGIEVEDDEELDAFILRLKVIPKVKQ